jgi:molybdopterin converting factor subunit 1
VTVRLFARASDLAGTASTNFELPSSATVRDVRAVLLNRFPGLKPLADSLLAAVNSEYADDETVLTQGCEVAFFPPVSGG